MGADLAEDFAVLVVGGDDRGEGVVLGSGTDEAGAADVDLLDRFFAGDTGAGDRLLEGIEIHDHQFHGDDAVFGDQFEVLRLIVADEDAAEDFGMERFDPSVEHLGKLRVLSNVASFDAVIEEVFSCSAGAVDFDATSNEALREGGEARFVANTDDRAADWWLVQHGERPGARDQRLGKLANVASGVWAKWETKTPWK